MTSLLGFIGPPKILGPPLNLAPLKLVGGGGGCYHASGSGDIAKQLPKINFENSKIRDFVPTF